MRGITPVIAIILLLLMAVAAAGGFYFVYQGFTESGEESGATQIEQLGEQSLAQIQIESAAGGRIYVRNVGASDIDLSKATVYVENQPVSVNRSADTLAERSRAVLKLTEVPGCTQEQCEVKISGAASTSRTVDLSGLVCYSDADCYAGETCEGGVCAESEGEEETDCGNGVCDEGETSSNCPADCYCGNEHCDSDENGTSCFEDCGPRSIAFMGIDMAEMDVEIYAYDWDGSTYVQGENLSQNSYLDEVTHSDYSPEGKAIVVGNAGESSTSRDVLWTYWDGETWSSTDNVTSGELDQEAAHVAFNSSGEVIAVWRLGDVTPSNDGDDVAWASFDGSTWSEPQNMTDTPAEIEIETGTFAFSADDKGMAIWPSNAPGGTNAPSWINYSVFDGSWSAPGVIASRTSSEWEDFYHPTAGFNSTHGMAVWERIYHLQPEDWDEVLQWSTWNGAGWTEPQNVSDELAGVTPVDVVEDGEGGWLLVFQNTTSSPTWPQWYRWNGGWQAMGNLTASGEIGNSNVIKNENGAIMVTIAVQVPPSVKYVYWDGTGWSEPVAFSA